MIKQIILISTILFCGWIFFSSCSSYSDDQKLIEPTASREDTSSSGIPGAGTIPSVAWERTTDELLAAYKAETTSTAKFTAYSKKAEQEGYPKIALLFKATSTAEQFHANNHRSVLEESGIKVAPINPEFTVNTTKENLHDAIKGESYETTTMYPEFLKNARVAGNPLASLSMAYSLKTGKINLGLYKKALALLENKTAKPLSTVYYVCPTCGNTYEITPPHRCAVCMTNADKFIKIN
jgi:rubrerythrin